MKTPGTTVRLPDHQRELLEKIACEMGTTASSIIREAVTQYLNHVKNTGEITRKLTNDELMAEIGLKASTSRKHKRHKDKSESAPPREASKFLAA